MTSTDRIDGIPVIDSYRLTYTARDKTLSADVSDLGFRTYVPAVLYVRSARTGDILKFTGVPPVRDAENDILAFRYRNVTASVQLLLYND